MAFPPLRETIDVTKEVTMNRRSLWAVLVIGLALVLAPFALGLPGKSAAAAFGLFGTGLAGRFTFHHRARATTA